MKLELMSIRDQTMKAEEEAGVQKGGAYWGETGKEREMEYLIIIQIGYDCHGQRQTVYNQTRRPV